MLSPSLICLPPTKRGSVLFTLLQRNGYLTSVSNAARSSLTSSPGEYEWKCHQRLLLKGGVSFGLTNVARRLSSTPGWRRQTLPPRSSDHGERGWAQVMHPNEHGQKRHNVSTGEFRNRKPDGVWWLHYEMGFEFSSIFNFLPSNPKCSNRPQQLQLQTWYIIRNSFQRL